MIISLPCTAMPAHFCILHISTDFDMISCQACCTSEGTLKPLRRTDQFPLKLHYVSHDHLKLKLRSTNTSKSMSDYLTKVTTETLLDIPNIKVLFSLNTEGIWKDSLTSSLPCATFSCTRSPSTSMFHTTRPKLLNFFTPRRRYNGGRLTTSKHAKKQASLLATMGSPVSCQSSDDLIPHSIHQPQLLSLPALPSTDTT